MLKHCGKRAVEQHLEALRAGKTSLMISPRHEEARKVAAIVRQQLKAEGAIGAEDHAVTVLRRMDLGSEACRDLLHYAPGRKEWQTSTPDERSMDIIIRCLETLRCD